MPFRCFRRQTSLVIFVSYQLHPLYISHHDSNSTRATSTASAAAQAQYHHSTRGVDLRRQVDRFGDSSTWHAWEPLQYILAAMRGAYLCNSIPATHGLLLPGMPVLLRPTHGAILHRAEVLGPGLACILHMTLPAGDPSCFSILGYILG